MQGSDQRQKEGETKDAAHISARRLHRIQKSEGCSAESHQRGATEQLEKLLHHAERYNQARRHLAYDKEDGGNEFNTRTADHKSRWKEIHLQRKRRQTPSQKSFDKAVATRTMEKLSRNGEGSMNKRKASRRQTGEEMMNTHTSTRCSNSTNSIRVFDMGRRTNRQERTAFIMRCCTICQNAAER